MDTVIADLAASTRHGLRWWLDNRLNQARLDFGWLTPLPREDTWPERRLRRGPEPEPRPDAVVIFHFDGTATIAKPNGKEPR